MKRGGPLNRRTQLKRGGPLRRQSSKTARIERNAAPVRRQWKAEAKCCMACGYGPPRRNPSLPPQMSQLCCHEILRGSGNRLRALDKPFAVLVLCIYCNVHEFTDKVKWPEAKQLALLKRRVPDAYDLEAYNHLARQNAPTRITPEEVEAWESTLAATHPA